MTRRRRRRDSLVSISRSENKILLLYQMDVLVRIVLYVHLIDVIAIAVTTRL
jgi:hypothetical protein